MIRNLMFFCLVCVFIVSCGNAAEESGQEDQNRNSSATASPPSGPTALLNGCYQMVIKEDTAELRLNIKGDSVSGPLFYHWKERDHNDGTIRGTLRDSIIQAVYEFRFEGLTSYREVAFKIKNNTLYQAYGELVTAKDTVRFRFPDKVVYDRKNPFVKVKCS